MTLHELSHEIDVLIIAVGVALGFAVPAVAMCFMLLFRSIRHEQRDGGSLRLDGHTLHGRIVFVDRIGWEREIVRWGLDGNGCTSFDMHTDHALFTGYLIEGPDNIDPQVRTDPNAPFRARAAAVPFAASAEGGHE